MSRDDRDRLITLIDSALRRPGRLGLDGMTIIQGSEGQWLEIGWHGQRYGLLPRSLGQHGSAQGPYMGAENE